MNISVKEDTCEGKLRAWRTIEEYCKYARGWDFTGLDVMHGEKNGGLPWNYVNIINSYRKSWFKILDIDTGGGEVLLSIGHNNKLLYATEGYKPNVELCKERLIPLGVNFVEAHADEKLPFDNNAFDMVICRHGSYSIEDVHRVLKENGLFITQQVGENNNRDLIKKVIGEYKPAYPGHTLNNAINKAIQGDKFDVLEASESRHTVKYMGMSSIIAIATRIPWEFISFSVDNNYNNLISIENEIKANGYVVGTDDRFYMVLRKKRKTRNESISR